MDNICMRMFQVILIVIAARFALSRPQEGCRIRYGRRGCTDDIYTGVLVTCDGRGTDTVIPGTIPEDTVYLSLVNYQFSRLARANFTRMTKVKCIHILNSGIHGIAEDAFSDMELLAEVELFNTNLTSQDVTFINHPDFRGTLVAIGGSDFISGIHFNGTEALQKLKGLRLEHNKIESISPGVLSNLAMVEELSLNNNALLTLDWVRLSSLAKLNYLTLHGNKIQTIPQTVLNTFSAVKKLTLADNPLHCNCHLRWLKEFYDVTTDKVLDYEEMTCATPFQKKFIDTFVEDFSCSPPSSPKLEFIELTEKEEYIVSCSSSSDPAPTITLTLPDTKRSISPPHADISHLTTATPRVLTGPGVVTCEATNSHGTRTAAGHVPYEGYISGEASVRSTLLLFAPALILCVKDAVGRGRLR